MGDLVNTTRKAKLKEIQSAYRNTLLQHVTMTKIIDDLIDAEHKRVMKQYKPSEKVAG